MKPSGDQQIAHLWKRYPKEFQTVLVELTLSFVESEVVVLLSG